MQHYRDNNLNITLISSQYRISFIVCGTLYRMYLLLVPQSRQLYQPGHPVTLWRSCLRPCATNRKVSGSIPDVTGIFYWHPSGCPMALGSTQPLNEMSTSKGGRCVGLTTLRPSCAGCHEIWEPQCPGTNRGCQSLCRDRCTFCIFDTVTGLLRISSRDICIIKGMVILQLVRHILYGRSPAACKAVLHSRQNGLFHPDDRTPRSCRNARMVIDFCYIFLFVTRLPTCGTIWLSVNALGCAPTGASTQERFAVIRTRQSRSACATAWWVLTVFDVPSYKGRPRRWSLWRRDGRVWRVAGEHVLL